MRGCHQTQWNMQASLFPSFFFFSCWCCCHFLSLGHKGYARFWIIFLFFCFSFIVIFVCVCFRVTLALGWSYSLMLFRSFWLASWLVRTNVTFERSFSFAFFVLFFVLFLFVLGARNKTTRAISPVRSVIGLSYCYRYNRHVLVL